MKINMPIKREGKIEYIPFEIETSLVSQMKFEEKFPDLASREDLLEYSVRIRDYKGMSVGKLLSELKLLYCWINTELEFIDFVRLFDFKDLQYVKELISKIKEAFSSIINASAEKN